MSSKRLKFIVDDNIPFIKGRLEKIGDVIYTDQFGFTPDLVRDADGLIIRTRTQCNESLLDGSSVRLVATATIGTDQIDIPWCESNGITVRNSPGCNAPGVAQYVWSALLRLGMKPGKHTIGVVGHGNVGSIVADWGKKMGFDILLCDPPKAKRTGRGEDYISLEELLRRSDAITLHTPLTRDGEHPTFHLIGEREESLLHTGQILVNAARGPVVDTKAFIKALDRGIKGVVDTWEGEPDLNINLLEKAEIGTFHIAGYSREGKERATRMVLEAVEEQFGVEVDTGGLAPTRPDNENVTALAILNSYNPFDDDHALRETPAMFDILRASYNYRNEPTYV